MRRALTRPWLLAGLVFVMAFGLYGFTVSTRDYGYEGENAALAEGLLRTGRFQLVEDSPLRVYGVTGKDGRSYGRSGFAQPVLQAPFYAVGWALDGLREAPPEYRYRDLALSFYNPFAAALAAAAMFGIVLLTRRSIPWAVAIAAAFTWASIAWPYSKIGMDTTLMLFVVLSLLAAVVAAQRPRPWTWAATGAAMGMAAASKPYGLLLVAPVPLLLWAPWRAADRSTRVRLGLALLGVLGLFGALIAHHNWVRYGSITDFGAAPYTTTGWAPVNAAGFLFSPGKGLAFYSPLILLGLLGLPRLWREQRAFALVLIGVVAVGIVVPAIPNYWTDETWGPRYIVPVAGLLLIPVAWWTTTRARGVVAVGLAALAVGVQIVAVTVPYDYYVRASTPFHTLVGAEDPLSGLPYTDPEPPALGHDANRWVPELSPLVFQANVLVSTTKESLGASPTVVHYRPYLGKAVAFDLNDAEARFGMPVPDFWWTSGEFHGRAKAFAWLLAALCVISAVLLAAAVRWAGAARPPPARAGSSPPSAQPSAPR
jgi:Dolichyl-phosphate-mannose-protein mannosyltransferase